VLAVPPLEVGSAVAGGELLGVRDEAFGLAFDEGEEVLAGDAEGAVYEAVAVGLVREGEVAFEDHAIMAGGNGDGGRGELYGEAGWSLAWRSAPERCLSNTILRAERLLCFCLFGCGVSRVRRKRFEGGGGHRRTRHPTSPGLYPLRGSGCRHGPLQAPVRPLQQ